MEQSPILFLDIDGVLNHSRACASSVKNSSLDPENVAHFNHIIQATAAKIVISSDWRWFYPYEQLCQLLREAGVAGEFLGTTSTLWLEQSNQVWMSRGAEIGEWLETYGYEGNFVILDDCDDIAPYLDRWVRTDPHKGLTEIKAQQAIAMLKTKQPS